MADEILIARMKRDHTVIRPVVMEGYPEARHVYFKVGPQSFCVTPHGCETQEEAEWMQGQLAIALANLLSPEQPHGEKA